MRLYACFFKNQKLLVEAPTTRDAQMRAGVLFRLKNKDIWRIAVVVMDQPVSITN